MFVHYLPCLDQPHDPHDHTEGESAKCGNSNRQFLRIIPALEVIIGEISFPKDVVLAEQDHLRCISAANQWRSGRLTK